MAAPQLVDQYGNPIDRAMLTQEIAAATITGVRSPIAGYPADGLNPRRLANILRAADLGDPLRYFELAEQIEERDLHYAGVLATRKRSVAQLAINVDAASDDAAHVEQADMVRDFIARGDLGEELFDVLDAIGKGVSFSEIIWDTSEGQWRPGRLEWRDPRWFRFDRVDGRTPQLMTEAGFVPLMPFKFVCATIRAKSGLPVRSGLARLAAWSWMFKAFTQRDWAIFVQTFGQPIRVGKYQPGATEDDKDTLFRAVANIAGDCAAIVPDSMMIEFVESKNVSSSLDLYERRADWLDQQVSKAVLGQTTTTDAIAGGHAVSQEHRQVQEDIERADSRTLSAILNRDLVRPWIDLEYGPQDAYPTIRIGREDATDVEVTIDGIVRLVPLGLRVQKSWANDLLGIPDPDAGAELLAVPSAPAALPPPAAPFGVAGREALQAAAPAIADNNTADRLAAETAKLAAPVTDRMIDMVRALVDNAESLDGVRESLKALKPNLPADELAQLMQMALAMADLSGRAEIADAAASNG